MTRDEYLESLKNVNPHLNCYEYSEDVKYQCPKCGGDVRENYTMAEVICTLPPIYVSTMECMKCGFTERIEHK